MYTPLIVGYLVVVVDDYDDMVDVVVVEVRKPAAADATATE